MRLRLRLRQEDVAARAGVSQDTVSRIERGRLSALQLRTVRAVLQAIEMELRINPSWRGGELDRLMDEDHAVAVGGVAELLEGLGWVTGAEVSFAVYGERGSIDLVAWHPGTRVLLIIEVKTSGHLSRGDAAPARHQGAPRGPDRRGAVWLAAIGGGSHAGPPRRLDAPATGRPPHRRAGSRLSAAGLDRESMAGAAERGRCPADLPVTLAPGASWARACQAEASPAGRCGEDRCPGTLRGRRWQPERSDPRQARAGGVGGGESGAPVMYHAHHA